MEKKYIVIIAVVAVVIVVAAAAVFMMGGEKKVYHDASVFDGRLPIFGNANNDDYIDDSDVDLIQDIIDGKKKATYVTVKNDFTEGKEIQRSLADANADGKIDSADLELVKKMVKREAGIKVNYINVDNVLSTCNFPLTTMAVAYKSHYELVAAAGITTEVTYVCDMVGYSGGKYGDYSQWYPQYKDAKCFGNRATPDYEVFTDNPPSCFITGTKTSYAKTAEENLNKLGVDIVRLPAYENGWAVPAMLMLGFLTGHEDTASKYVEKADYVYNTIEAHVKDIPMSQRPYVFIHHNATQVSKYGSGVIETAVLAGASTPIDRGFPAGKVDAEAVALTMNPEWIVLEPWHGVLETTDGSVDATFAWDLDNLYNKDKAGIQAIDHTQAYKDGKVLMFTQGVRFGPSSYIATAYIANHIYPGVFNFDVEGLFDDYMKSYHPEVNAKEWFEYTYFDLEFAEKHHNASA